MTRPSAPPASAPSWVEMLPCPLCGSPAKGLHNSPDWIVRCMSKDPCCKTDYFRTLEKAIEAWNRRAPGRPPPASDARDAVRYRWLRVEYEGAWGGYPNPGTPIARIIREFDGRRVPATCTAEELDAAIDAAIAAMKGGEG